MYTGFLDLGTRKLNPCLGEVDDCKVLGPLGQKHTVSFLEDLQVETWFLRSISMYCMGKSASTLEDPGSACS